MYKMTEDEKRDCVRRLIAQAQTSEWLSDKEAAHVLGVTDREFARHTLKLRAMSVFAWDPQAQKWQARYIRQLIEEL